MVFPSLPLYLDPPNWQPRNETQIPDQLSPPPPPGGGSGDSGGGGGGTTSIRPGSMTDRARLAKIPQPEAGLKCPRCESTNTKFCYFNNYNLSQPRHFCKTCRRYWTRGGALRNVPVGGGCRRNKRSKTRNRSKSPAPERQLAGSGSTTTVPPQSHLPFLPSLHHLSDYGLNLGMIPHPSAPARGGADFEFHEVPNSSTSVTSAITDHWRLPQSQQFPNFLANLEQPTVLYTFDSPDQTAVDTTRYSQVGPVTGQLGFSKPQIIENNGISPVAGAVKMEENKGLNLTKNFQFWPGSGPGGSNNINAWAGGAADMSGFSSSSTSHLLG